MRWTRLVERAASWSWAPAQPASGEDLGGGEHGERPVAQRGERLRLGEDAGSHRHLVAPVPERLGVEVSACDLVGRRARAGVRPGEQPGQTETGEGGQQRQAAAHDGVLAGVGGDRGELVGAGAVQEHHAGDLLGVPGGVGHGVGAAGRVPDQHEGAGLAGRGEQGVQVLGGGHAVLGVLASFAPALSGAVVGADPGGVGRPGRDPGPGGGDLAQAVEEHDGGAAVAAAVQVQPVAADLVALAGGGVGALVADAPRCSRRWRPRTRGPGRRRPGGAASVRRRSRTGATWTNIHTASASTTGGHTQLSRVMASYPGCEHHQRTPVAPMAAAGTTAQRCGRVV